MPAVLSKMELARSVALEVLWKNANWKSALMAAGVGAGSVMLLRGIRRDRQSSTASATDKLLKESVDKGKTEQEKERSRKQRSFWQRLKVIIYVICPGVGTKEAWFLFLLSALLIGRIQPFLT